MSGFSFAGDSPIRTLPVSNKLCDISITPESESTARPGARQVHVDTEAAASGPSRIGYGQADRLSARGYVTKLSACS